MQHDSSTNTSTKVDAPSIGALLARQRAQAPILDSEIVPTTTDRGNRAEQSGLSPPPTIAALSPLLDRVRRIDFWRTPKGSSPIHVQNKLTDAVMLNHVNNILSIGACPIERGGDTTRLAVLDLDSHKGETKWPAMQAYAKQLMTVAEAAFDIKLIPFRSTGGRGIHLYAIWDQPQDARSVRVWMRELLASCQLKDGAGKGGVKGGFVEVFPKQDSVPFDGWGSMFVLPMSGASIALDPHTLMEIELRDVFWPVSGPVPEAPPEPERELLPVVFEASQERLASALFSLDPNDFGYGGIGGQIGWLEILFAVHAATQGSDAGRAMIHEWSSKFERYSADHTDKQWDNAKLKAGGIGPATLFAVAKKAGWRDPEELAQMQQLFAAHDEAQADAFLAAVPGWDVVGLDEPSVARAADLPVPVRAIVAGWVGSADAQAIAQAAEAARASGKTEMTVPARLNVEMNDAGNVAVLVHLQKGNLRYDTSTETFIFWVGSRWERDEDGTRMREAIKQVARYWQAEHDRVRALVDAAAKAEADGGAAAGPGRKRSDGLVPGGKAAGLDDLADKLAGWAKACGNAKQINAIVALAKVETGIVVEPDMLDRNPHLLGVENGVVDLRTGQLHADARDEFVTRRIPVRFDPAARAPRWLQFQDEIAGLPLPVSADGAHAYVPRPALVAYKQRWAGSMLIGENVGQKFYTATGEGSNGKSLELETYVEIMGPLAVKLPQGAFMAGSRGPRDADAASPTLAALRGARLALASETDAGTKLNTGDVKAVTGDAEITARNLFANSQRFRLEATPVLLTNHPPTIQTVDNAIAGRIAIVPYERTWNRPDGVEHDPSRPDADTGLKAALRAEHEGVLAWMVHGAVQVLANGGRLNPPPEVSQKTEAYLQEQSVFGSWLAQLERVDHRDGATTAELLQSLQDFARTRSRPAGKEAANVTVFSFALKKALAREGREGRDASVRRWPLRVVGPTGPISPARFDQ